jgi:hypothetical protein
LGDAQRLVATTRRSNVPTIARRTIPSGGRVIRPTGIGSAMVRRRVVASGARLPVTARL